MKPLKLEFCGINSFSEKAVIDFENLTKNGIFGIFGDTGSGKSTILDSINFALYGDIDRSKEKTDIINYKSDALEVKFKFEITYEGERKIFLVERTLKKNKSGTHKASLYDLNKNLCIADNATSVKSNIISIIGLEAEDFRKCIALPQGEFAQFVKSQTSERIKLIERLFSLSKYGNKLKEKLFIKEKEVDIAYNELLGKLSVYEDVNFELLESTKSDIDDTNNEILCLKDKVDEANKRFNELRALFDKKSELLEVKGELENLRLKKLDIDELKKSISLIESAKLCYKNYEAICDKTALINRTAEEILKYEAKRIELSEAYNLVLKKIEDAKFDKNIAKSSMLLGKLESVIDLPEKLNGVNNKLVELRKQFAKVKSNLEALNQKLASLNGELTDDTNKIQEISVDDIETFVKSKYTDVILKEEYIKQINIYADLRSDIKIFEDGSELYKYIKKRFDEQIKLYEKRILEVKDVNSVKILNEFKVIKENLDKKDQINSKILQIKSQIARVETEIKNGDLELVRIKADGEERSRERLDICNKLKQAFGSDNLDFAFVIESERAKLDDLNTNKQNLLTQKDKFEDELKQIEILITSLSSQKTTYELELNKLKEDFELGLKNANFTCVDDCKKLIMQFERVEAEESISQFESALAVAENKEKELLKFDGILNINQEEVYSAESLKNSLEESLNNLNSKLAVLQKHHQDLKARLNTKNQLLKVYEDLSAERNLVYQLKDLIKNNKFLEFIAKEYLYEISSLASGSLLKLTSGRYFLTYKDNFFVGDNFDCGNLRGVNTLSGGETFLVSLSLALALSSTICAKALRSIEFFFLDEGFGTLDNTLIDTVMDALEKLKSQQFTIGIISHVEELKHRINSKITVNKATESHGSTVQISY
ncbi:MAG: SMC family ATPase [Clostridiales bacterium]|nr:SMC family ATPase [Clostridiales bacterium]